MGIDEFFAIAKGKHVDDKLANRIQSGGIQIMEKGIDKDLRHKGGENYPQNHEELEEKGKIEKEGMALDRFFR